jgi:ATP-dependent RNA helicase DHX57
MVILKALNPKTKEMTVLQPFKLPPSQKHLADQPTAVEARNFAATYALFRVCSMRNIHMSLPPNHRDLWKGDFQELKKEDVKEDKGWMYEADPFATLREREQAKALMAKKREEKEKRIAKETSKPGGTSLPIGQLHSGSASRGNIMKGWERVPKIEMGRRTRTHIEDLVRRKAIWNPHSVHLSQPRQAGIVNEFALLGFRRSHVEEAVAECKDREETLEWLLIHVPEDDLPPWSLPEGYVAGISMASSNLKREGSIKRVAAAGYATELCEKIFDTNGNDEGRAAGQLQDILLYGDDNTSTQSLSKLKIDGGEGQDWLWEEEQMTLESIYGDRYKPIDPDVCQISLRARNVPRTLRLQARKPSSVSYPEAVPVLSIISEPPLPAYIRLSIIRKSVQHAAKDLVGEQMIFSLVEWLESNIGNIIERPGKLRDVAAAASVVGESHRDKMNGSRSRNRKTMPRSIDWRLSNEKSIAILSSWKARQKSPAQEKMLKVRQSLPAWNLKDAIIDSVNNHQVTIISGETGSGKSTQSVQFILDDMIQRNLGGAAKIICTQPRRISALGLADRVSDERCTAIGTEIGYAIRGESKQTLGTTKITFVTTGVLLRRLQTSGGSTDDVVASLADVSHVVVDEVHERSLDTDFLLILLRDVLKRRKDLKVILMSATLDANVFANYFGGSSVVGQIEIQGRTFPVTDYYLDDVVRLTNFEPRSRFDPGRLDEADPDVEGMDFDMAKKIQDIGMGGINYDLLAQTVEAIDDDLGKEEGGILIFLPGTLEINKTLEAIRHVPNLHALPLHASLLPAEQKRVFPPAPRGKRKVIAATNVAETSITIPDIVAVIDTGRVKETSFDPQNNMVKLEEVWASRAACKQRRGRAGRVAAGTCYKLYTRNVEAKRMADRPEPEIRRVPLEQLCLSVKAMGVLNVPTFLASALTPPESMAVEGAIGLLGRMGALDGDDLTALGRHLSLIPADLRCGKLLVYGALFGCLEACLTIAAILTVRSPFVSPQGKRDEAKAARARFTGNQGDLVGDLHAFDEWSNLRSTLQTRDMRAWCDENFLSNHTLWDISSNKAQYASSLRETGFLPHGPIPANYNAHNSNLPLLRALIAGAFNPQIARIGFPDTKFAPSISGAVALDPEARTIKYFNQDNGRVFIHPSSSLFDAQTFPGEAKFVAYFNKMATSKVFVRDLTRTYCL